MMERSDEGRPRARRLLIGLAVGVGGVLGVALLWTLTARASTVRAYLVPSASMSPTVSPGDRITADMTDDPQPNRGEIWIFRLPAWSNTGNSTVIKRVMGLPGDEIEVKEGRLWINGEALIEPYLGRPFTYTLPKTTIGKDEFFMLGDDRESSADSHIWGALPRDHLVGRGKLSDLAPLKTRPHQMTAKQGRLLAHG